MRKARNSLMEQERESGHAEASKHTLRVVEDPREACVLQTRGWISRLPRALWRRAYGREGDQEDSIRSTERDSLDIALFRETKADTKYFVVNTGVEGIQQHSTRLLLGAYHGNCLLCAGDEVLSAELEWRHECRERGALHGQPNTLWPPLRWGI